MKILSALFILLSPLPAVAASFQPAVGGREVMVANNGNGTNTTNHAKLFMPDLATNGLVGVAADGSLRTNAIGTGLTIAADGTLDTAGTGGGPTLWQTNSITNQNATVYTFTEQILSTNLLLRNGIIFGDTTAFTLDPLTDGTLLYAVRHLDDGDPAASIHLEVDAGTETQTLNFGADGANAVFDMNYFGATINNSISLASSSDGSSSLYVSGSSGNVLLGSVGTNVTLYMRAGNSFIDLVAYHPMMADVAGNVGFYWNTFRAVTVANLAEFANNDVDKVVIAADGSIRSEGSVMNFTNLPGAGSLVGIDTFGNLFRTNDPIGGFLANSNLSYIIGAAGTNNAIGVFQANSNLSYVIGLANTNLTTAAFQSGTNYSLAIFQSVSNLAYVIGLANTNLTLAIVTNYVTTLNGLATNLLAYNANHAGVTAATDTSTSTNYIEAGSAYPGATAVMSGGQLRLNGGLSPARIAITNWNMFTNSISTNVISTVDGIFTVYATNGACAGCWTNGADMATTATNLATNINSKVFFGTAIQVSNYVTVLANSSNVFFYPLAKVEMMTVGSVTNGATNLNAIANSVVVNPVGGKLAVGTNNATAALEVQGNVQVSGNQTNAGQITSTTGNLNLSLGSVVLNGSLTGVGISPIGVGGPGLVAESANVVNFFGNGFAALTALQLGKRDSNTSAIVMGNTPPIGYWRDGTKISNITWVAGQLVSSNNYAPQTNLPPLLIYKPMSGTHALIVTPAGDTQVTNAGLIIGPSSAAITNILTGSASLDFGSTAAGTVSDLPITVTGVTSNNCHVSLSVPWESASGGGSFTTFNSNDVVYVRFSNQQLVNAVDPGPGTFSVLAFRVK